MLKNLLCPYCAVRMVKAENLPDSRSVEHLIPRTLLRVKTKNDAGDFYACRRCNGRKSHIDYVLGVVTKSQAPDEEFAVDALASALTVDDGRAARFRKMLQSLEEADDGVHFTIPWSGAELLEYMQFLGKGQYFRRSGLIYRKEHQVMLLSFANKQVHQAVESSYFVRHGTNPFHDLRQNLYAEVLSGGDCTIYSKNANFLFIFHDYTSISIKIKRRNQKNTAREIQMNQQILEDFG